MRRFIADLFDHLLLVFMMAVVLTVVVLVGSLFKSCSSESQAMRKAEVRAEQEAEYQKMCDLYSRVYDKANASYWDLANEYQDLYNQYMNDPGRTYSLDSFTDPTELYLDLPEYLEDDFLD